VRMDCTSPEIGAVDLTVVIDEIDRHLRKLGAQAIVVLRPDFFTESEQDQQPGHGWGRPEWYMNTAREWPAGA
jgi:hypothetical protein